MPNGNTLHYRVGSIEHRIEMLERLEPAVMAERIHHHTREFEELRDEMRALKRSLYTFAFTIAASAVVFAIGILQVIA
jgi:hypothetical protein